MFDASCRPDAARPPASAGGLRGGSQSAVASNPSAVLRVGTLGDLAALEALEGAAFAHDRIARRSFVRFLNAPNASLIVADCDGVLAGYALVLFRAHSRLARLYSI